MSTVADFNDNLLYHMKREYGLDNFICDDDDEYGHLRSSHVQELEETLQADEYIGSFLTTKSTTAQPPHVDYTWEVLEQYGEENPTQSLMLGFFPLTEEGMFLQIWPTASTNLSIDGNIIEGEIIFIPYKKILIVPATTIHGGGFRTTTFVEEPGRCGNLRFHLYLAASATTGTGTSAGTGATLPAHQTNKYTEPHDKTKELSRRYVDSKYMQVLLQSLFV
ncbi:hypothetical protein FRACYDRAFT_268903 [Fragilariopsis cylindrus CCMP1102]|uniref:Uncharacterized protein n=1 Tax=Fragilariopsis cylindrus CCMP1102 TaxID=635003 RepID=A0A1E7FDE9_9STRA|nr:hypothetical protein FRACYDRAFT_268903 [Fragilariopsis cylindrus CCMP1102]|eukprot:OEU16171.1 hypothetical protein FRACYDRAFT_268903 [Fragilariopsis cylindrus CCMP1102]